MNRALLISGILSVSAAFAVQPLEGMTLQIPRNSIPQEAPYADQPISLNELVEVFNSGRVPSPAEVSGAWVAIGFLGEFSSVNCGGVMRDQTLEWVLVADRYSIEIDMIGAFLQMTSLTPDDRGSMVLPVDFQGDSVPVYRCRLTSRETLACLFGEPTLTRGVEFRKMRVRANQRANHKVDVP